MIGTCAVNVVLAIADHQALRRIELLSDQQVPDQLGLVSSRAVEFSTMDTDEARRERVVIENPASVQERFRSRQKQAAPECMKRVEPVDDARKQMGLEKETGRESCREKGWK